MSSHPELWRQIVADRMANIQQETRVRQWLNDATPRGPNWAQQQIARSITGLGRALVAFGQQLQRMEEAPNGG